MEPVEHSAESVRKLSGRELEQAVCNLWPEWKEWRFPTLKCPSFTDDLLGIAMLRDFRLGPFSGWKWMLGDGTIGIHCRAWRPCHDHKPCKTLSVHISGGNTLMEAVCRVACLIAIERDVTRELTGRLL